jgi:hypothetical protein
MRIQNGSGHESKERTLTITRESRYALSNAANCGSRLSVRSVLSFCKRVILEAPIDLAVYIRREKLYL